MNVFTILVLAMIGEGVWETLKLTWQQGKLNVDRVGALLTGILVAIATGVDIIKIIGIDTVIPYIGVIFTGILISRGANFIHDLLQATNNLSSKNKTL